MNDVKVWAFFQEQGWEPPFEYESEVCRLMRELNLTRKEAECRTDEKIRRDLKMFVALAFAQASSTMS